MKGRSLPGAAVVGALLLCTLGAPRAEEPAAKPDAKLELSAKALGAGAGYAWGVGKLDYNGKTYDVTVDGLTVGTVGATQIEAAGDVYGLKKLEDFDGTYTAGTAAATAGGGLGAISMKNQHGVQVNMTATTRGVSLTLGVSGVKLAVKK